MAYTSDNMLKSIDWITICIYLALVIFGWFSVCGASYDYGEIDFFSFDTRAGKQLVWISCSLGLGFILLMLEDKLYDMFAYIFYGAMMLLLLVTPFLAEDTKGSYSWIKFGPVSLQPAEFAKFATALALAKFMNVYGFTMSKLKYSLPVTGMILLPMLLIILQRETGSALVYLAFFFMLYREGMPGSILFAGICAVVYFVVGIRFSQEMMADDCTSVGEFSVLLLITILSALLVNSYCKKKPVVWYILGFGSGGTLLALLFSYYVIPFDITWFQYGLCVALVFYLIFLSMRERMRDYFYIALFAIGSVGFLFSADYVFENVLEPHQQVRIKEEGFLGSAIVLLLFMTLILRLIVIAERQHTRFGRVYGYSVLSIFLFHLFINIGMVLGLTPVIGIPLPFFSYGGSSLWGFTILLFVFLRIDSARGSH